MILKKVLEFVGDVGYFMFYFSNLLLNIFVMIMYMKNVYWF